jgi:hypothetical protein
MPVKGDHRTLSKVPKIARHFDGAEPSRAEFGAFGAAQGVTLHRGRIEARRLTASGAPPPRSAGAPPPRSAALRLERRVIVKKSRSQGDGGGAGGGGVRDHEPAGGAGESSALAGADPRSRDDREPQSLRAGRDL